MNQHLVTFLIAVPAGMAGSYLMNLYLKRRARRQARKHTGSPRTPGQFLRGI